MRQSGDKRSMMHFEKILHALCLASRITSFIVVRYNLCLRLTLGTPSSSIGKSSSIVSEDKEVARENSTGVPSSTHALGASLNTPVLVLGPGCS